jgi:hypothetical protein
MSRNPIGDRPMTDAERQAKRRQAILDTTPALPAPLITKAEKEDLQRLINRREKVLKQIASARSATLLADFEQQMAAIYSFDDREVWAQATRRGQAAVDEANKLIAEECAKLGIPSQFAPSLVFGWMNRGENLSKARRDELRRAATTRIAAVEAQAIVQIGYEALRASTEITRYGLTSKVARQFLDELEPLERLMPPLDFRSIENDLIGKPIRDKYGSHSGTFEPLTVEPEPVALSPDERWLAEASDGDHGDVEDAPGDGR